MDSTLRGIELVSRPSWEDGTGLLVYSFSHCCTAVFSWDVEMRWSPTSAAAPIFAGVHAPSSVMARPLAASAPTAFASAVMRRTSTTRISGLLGVSMSTTLGRSARAAASAAGSVWSTKATR